MSAETEEVVSCPRLKMPIEQAKAAIVMALAETTTKPSRVVDVSCEEYPHADGATHPGRRPRVVRPSASRDDLVFRKLIHNAIGLVQTGVLPFEEWLAWNDSRMEAR